MKNHTNKCNNTNINPDKQELKTNIGQGITMCERPKKRFLTIISEV